MISKNSIAVTGSKSSYFSKPNSLNALLVLVSGVCMMFLFSSNISNVSNNVLASMGELINPQPKQNASNFIMTENDETEEALSTDIPTIVSDAQAFYNSLSSTQQAQCMQTYTNTLARKWSNLPCGSGCRNGVQLGDLNATQLALALKVMEDALGSTTNNGYDELLSINVAEDALVNAGANSSQYNSGLRWIAFLNAPSATGAWMLQYGGHHYAANISFNNGHFIGATPFFVALEPATFTYNGTYYAPMEDERDAFRAMLASLSTTEFNTAKLSTTFSDCLMSPGESNGNSNTFPTTKQGLAVSGLTTTQKNLVLAAIENYTDDVDSTLAESLMALYTNEIDQTYIAFTGSATVGSATSFLNANSNYVRIDGPTVWIEFACQNGVVIQNQIHYHSVWRDHNSDYGVDLTGSAIDEFTVGLNEIENVKPLKVYPNPSSQMIKMDFPRQTLNATVNVIDITGKIVSSSKVSGSNLDLNIERLTSGTYFITVTDKSGVFRGKFLKK
ncbi:MAG: DUF3500 domain-containing protein [Chitinophagales bacterium]|nr:DUF3500 domain-containing protein [Bacteroidota bacterium]MCB9044155.1 DUF3500 domain-containing protein [Chitinophagales bacterium]